MQSPQPRRIQIWLSAWNHQGLAVRPWIHSMVFLSFSLPFGRPLVVETWSWTREFKSYCCCSPVICPWSRYVAFLNHSCLLFLSKRENDALPYRVVMRLGGVKAGKCLKLSRHSVQLAIPSLQWLMETRKRKECAKKDWNAISFSWWKLNAITCQDLLIQWIIWE